MNLPMAWTHRSDSPLSRTGSALLETNHSPEFPADQTLQTIPRILMKFSTLLSLLLLSLLLGAVNAVAVQPLGSAITYNAHVSDSSGPVSGRFDVKFTLYWGDPEGETNPVPNGLILPVEMSDILIQNGVLTVAPDFGSGAFFGTQLWLLLEIRRH